MNRQGEGQDCKVKPSERLGPYVKKWEGHLDSLADIYVRSTRRHYAECAEFAKEMLDGKPTVGELAAGVTQQMFKCYEFAWSMSLAPLKMCVGGPTTKLEFTLDRFSEATDPIAIDRQGHSLADLSATDLKLLDNPSKFIPNDHVRLSLRGTDPDLLYVSLVDLIAVIPGLPNGVYLGKILAPGAQVMAVLRARLS